MNKEIESIINYYINNDVARDKVRDYIEELHNKIDKAIEYINTTVVMGDGTKLRNTIDGERLFEILKGDVDE